MHFIYFSSVFFHFEGHSNASRNCLSNARRRRSRWGKNGKAFICSRITLLILRHIDITSSSRAPNMTGICTASIKYTRSILCFNFLAHIAWVITNKILLSRWLQFQNLYGTLNVGVGCVYSERAIFHIFSISLKSEFSHSVNVLLVFVVAFYFLSLLSFLTENEQVSGMKGR